MRSPWITLAALAALPLTPSAAELPSAEPWVVQSRTLADRLGSALKAELGQAMQTGGPVAAIGVCKTRAPAIAAQLSQESGAVVGRTALRVRNPANAPDDVQRDVLEHFAAEFAKGPPARPLEAALEIQRGDSVERRYLRAIPMDTLCVTCHGTVIAPEVAGALARDYPADAATGFEPGQLRGAISVLWRVAAPGPAAPAE